MMVMQDAVGATLALLVRRRTEGRNDYGTIASLHIIDALRADDAGAAWPSARAVLLSRTRGPEDRRIEFENGESRVPAQVFCSFSARRLQLVLVLHIQNSTPSGSHPVLPDRRVKTQMQRQYPSVPFPFQNLYIHTCETPSDRKRRMEIGRTGSDNK